MVHENETLFSDNCPENHEKICQIDIYAGLLGCGKTTLIKKLLETEYRGKKVAIVENEIGKVNLDARELADSGFTISEITGGCVCCTIRGAFRDAVNQLLKEIDPDIIIIEPTGAADLSGMIESCRNLAGARIRRVVMMVNAKKIRMLLTVVGEFFIEQIRMATCIYLNFTERLTAEKIADAKVCCREVNPDVILIDTPIAEIGEETFARADLLSMLVKKEKPSSLNIRDLDEQRKGFPIRIRSGRDTVTLSTKTITLSRPLREEEYQNLKTLLLAQTPQELWRAKGLLPMETGRLVHLDLTFGDSYEKEEPMQESAGGTLVLIGELKTVISQLTTLGCQGDGFLDTNF